MKIRVCRFAISATVLIMLAMEVANAQRSTSMITMCNGDALTLEKRRNQDFQAEAHELLALRVRA
jgi:hypothetical protein